MSTIEKAIMYVQELDVSQGYGGTFSHKSSEVVDIVYSSGLLTLRAPFTGVVKRTRSNNNETWFESLNPVQYPDGTIDYMTLMMIHSDSLIVSTGTVVKQGEPLYTEGSKGNVTGAHIHLECGRGKFISPYGQYLSSATFIFNGKSYGIYKIYNQIAVHKALYIPADITIKRRGTDLNGATIPWTLVNDTSITEITDIKYFTPTVGNLEYFTTTDVNTNVGYLLRTETIDGIEVPMEYRVYATATDSNFTWYKFRHPDGNLYWCAMVPDRYVESNATLENLTDISIRSTNTIKVYNNTDKYSPADDVNLLANQFYQAYSKTTESFQNYEWYKVKITNSDYWVQKTSDIEEVSYDTRFESLDINSHIRITNDNCQYFNTPDVNDIAPDNKLPEGAEYVAISKSKEAIGDFVFIKFIYSDDKEYYVADLSDRVEIFVKTVEPPSGDYATQIWGIDVSLWQGEIDWDGVKTNSDKIDFNFIRCVSTNSSGLYVDSTFERNYQESKRVGIPTGTYAFTYALTTAEIDQELDLYLKQLEGKTLEYPIAWDFEWSEGFSVNGSTPAEVKANNTALALYALRKIKSKGYYPILYTYTYFIDSWLNYDEINNAGFDIWIADYRTTLGFTGRHTIWQFTSQSSINGISGNVDKNIGYFDYKRFIADNDYNNNVNMYPYENITGKYLTITKSNAQCFSFPSVYDENAQYMTNGTSYPVKAILLDEYDGYPWYIVIKDGIEVFIPYLSDRMILLDIPTNVTGNIPYEFIKHENKNIEIVGTVEGFTILNVNDENREYLIKDRVYSHFGTFVSPHNGYSWHIIINNDSINFIIDLSDDSRYLKYDGAPYKYTVEEGKYILVNVSTGYYDIPTTYSNNSIGFVSSGTSLKVIGKLNRLYQNLEWYLVEYGELNVYIPITDSVSIETYDLNIGVPYTKYTTPKYFNGSKSINYYNDAVNMNSIVGQLEDDVLYTIFGDFTHNSQKVYIINADTTPKFVYTTGITTTINLELDYPNTAYVPNEGIDVFYYNYPSTIKGIATKFETRKVVEILAEYSLSDVSGNNYLIANIDGNKVYLLNSADIAFIGTVYIDTIAKDDTYGQLQILNSTNSFIYPFNNIDQSVRLGTGEVFESYNYLKESSDNSEWFVINKNSQDLYINKSDINVLETYIYPKLLVSNMSVVVTSSLNALHRRASNDSEAFVIEPGSYSVLYIVNLDRGDGFVWYAINVNGTEMFISNEFDGTDLNFEINYEVNELREDAAIVVTGPGNVHGYESIDYNIISTYQPGDIIYVPYIISDDAIADTWYVSENEEYIKFTGDATFDYVYRNITNITSKKLLFISPDRAYLNAFESATYTNIPKDTIIDTDTIINANGFDWYRFVYNESTYYIKTTSSVLIDYVEDDYIYISPIEGTFAKPNIVYPMYKDIELTEYAGDLIIDKMYPVVATVTTNTEIVSIQISHEDTLYYTHKEIPLVYSYDFTPESDLYMKIKDSLPFYLSPLLEKHSDIILSEIKLIGKLNTNFNGKEWYVVDYKYSEFNNYVYVTEDVNNTVFTKAQSESLWTKLMKFISNLINSILSLFWKKKD